MDFTVEHIPRLIDEILGSAELGRDDVELFLMHQATYMMLERLRERLAIDEQRLPLALAEYGNTVSSTLPILLSDLRKRRLRPGTRTVMVGFGVGLSWAGCLWTETWQAKGEAATTATNARTEDTSARQEVAAEDDAGKQAA